MTLLTYKGKYVITSTTSSQTTSSSLQDDPQASQIFTLSATQVVLVIYAANNTHGQAMPATGMLNAISVDAADKANSWDGEGGANFCVRNCIFWIGTLAAGQHTVKGRFASNTSGSTCTINNRVLLIYIFDGDEFQYVDNATLQTTTSASFVDDSYASVTFTPTAACVLLALYNAANMNTTKEASDGKVTAINIAGSDYAQAEKSGGYKNFDSIFTVHALSRTAISTTVKGRFHVATSGTAVIDRRQLAVLLIDDTVPFDIVTSTTQVSNNTGNLIDDTQCTITRTPASASELLVIAMGTKRNGGSSSQYGHRYGIKVDANDRTNSCGAPGQGYGTAGHSAATAWAESVTAAEHIIKGRFSNNYSTQTAYVDARQVVALWFTGGVAPPTVTTDAATNLGLD